MCVQLAAEKERLQALLSNATDRLSGLSVHGAPICSHATRNVQLATYNVTYNVQLATCNVQDTTLQRARYHIQRGSAANMEQYTETIAALSDQLDTEHAAEALALVRPGRSVHNLRAPPRVRARVHAWSCACACMCVA